MDKKELNKEQLRKVAGGATIFKYICDECSNEIPADAEEKIDGIQTNLNDPTSVSTKFLKKCPYCNKYVEYHKVLS